MWWSRLHIIDKVGLFLFTAFIITKILFWAFEERFDQDLWQKEPTQRYKIVDNLLEQNILLGKPFNSVVQLLGQPNYTKTIGSDVFVYELGVPPSFSKLEKEQLLIIFVNGSVEYAVISRKPL